MSWTFQDAMDSGKTVVSTDGMVHRTGVGGVVLVDKDDTFMLFSVEENSDDETINLFGNTNPESSGFWKNPDSEVANSFELLLNRKPE